MSVIVSLMGPPGAGKGTIARALRKDYGYQVLSTGDLCRWHSDKATEFGQELRNSAQEGRLVSDEHIVSLVTNWIDETVRESDVVLDGFPRTVEQAVYFNKWLCNKQDYVFKVVFIDISQKESEERLQHRLVCTNASCQQSYQRDSLIILECNICQAALTTRSDDEKSVIEKRLFLYPLYAHRLINFYQSTHQEIGMVNVSALSVQQAMTSILSQVNR